MNHIIVFHGVDHKVGTTMISQSVAELIARERQKCKVLLLFLNGRESNEYVREEFDSITHIKMRIDNRMITGPEIIGTCRHQNNLYMLAGVNKAFEERYYHPETAEYILNIIKNEFDLIIIDSGNTLDNGLALGSLRFTCSRLLILTQQETMLKRYENLLPTYNKLKLEFSGYIINKFISQDPYTMEYLGERLDMHINKIKKVDCSDAARLAEIEGKTLLDFENDAYIEDIAAIANQILEMINIDRIQRPKRSRKWINFILSST